MVHVKSTGDYAWREDLYDQAGDILGENTKSGAIDGSAEFAVQMIPNLREAADHPDMTPELADVLSTNKVRVRYQVDTGIDINGDRDDAE